MKRTRHSPEQIVTKLHQAATELAGGKKIEEVRANEEMNVGAGTKGDGCEFKRGQVM